MGSSPSLGGVISFTPVGGDPTTVPSAGDEAAAAAEVQMIGEGSLIPMVDIKPNPVMAPPSTFSDPAKGGGNKDVVIPLKRNGKP